MAAAHAPLKPRWSGLALGVATFVLVALPLALGVASPGEGRLYDLVLRARRDSPSPAVILVCQDDQTSSSLGHDPGRAEMAQAIGNLWDKGASLIALDVLLYNPKDEAGDAALEAALKRADCVLACNPAQGLMPLERFRRQAVGLGSVDVVTDQDGILRRLPAPYMDLQDGSVKIRQLPLALQCALLTWFPKGVPAAVMDGSTLRFGTHAVPCPKGTMLIPFCGGDGTLARISFLTALEGKDLPDLKGRIALVGSSRPSQHDYFSVPIPRRRALSARAHEFRIRITELSTNSMAGVEVHGQMLSALLQGQSIVPLGTVGRWVLFGVLSSLGTLLMAFPMRPALSLSLWGLLGFSLLGASVVAIRGDRALPILALGLTWLAFAAGAFSYHRYRDFAEKRAVERLFSRYVSPNVARELLTNPDLVQLGGRRKVLTILFSDIRGFTTLSEQIPPEQVSALLNEYFTIMTRTLFRFDGTLDKFIGDAILAFFGDPVEQPDHPARALECAVAMQEEAAALRARSEREGKPPLHIGVAVHTGPVVVGNNGARDNFVYTVIGDSVNLTSRLQGLAQQDDVILTASTAELVPEFAARYRHEALEPVRVKGKAEPISIVRVTGRERD